MDVKQLSFSLTRRRAPITRTVSASPYRPLYYLSLIIVCSLFITNYLSFHVTENYFYSHEGWIAYRSPSKLNFSGFDNETGSNNFIVPNIIHFIYFNKTQLTFVDYVVLRAAMRNHGPDKFYIHSNNQEKPLSGKYWDWVRKDKELWSRIQVFHLDLPQEIFGQQLSKGWRLHHGSDIGRIRVLMKYGGIYLDNDVYVIQNLDKYRKYEFVLNLDEGKRFMGTQVLIAHKDARFLPLWLDTYRDYRPDKW